jgi:hypothetical protein
VTDRERVKLLFGPYNPPPLKRGDHTTCLFRDCLVIVTRWTDAPIPWPRCRALDGSGLLVEEELARAMRHRSAAAVMGWWRASPTAVYHWRRVLGDTQTDNEGTSRLVLAAAAKGDEAVKDPPQRRAGVPGGMCGSWVASPPCRRRSPSETPAAL